MVIGQIYTHHDLQRSRLLIRREGATGHANDCYTDNGVADSGVSVPLSQMDVAT